jgi:hypothetical protein
MNRFWDIKYVMDQVLCLQREIVISTALVNVGIAGKMDMTVKIHQQVHVMLSIFRVVVELRHTLGGNFVDLVICV